MSAPPALPPSNPAEVRLAWLSAWLGVTLAAIALLPSPALRAVAGVAGVALAVALAPAFVRRATPFSAALVTTVAACFSVATVIALSGLPWRTGISWSRAGGVGQPTAWLFTTTTLCFGIGVLATGRLIARAGLRRDALTPRGYLAATALSAISFAGFTVVALFPVGGAPASAFAHNIASWVAVGSFWAGMIGTATLPRVRRPLRWFSAVSALVVFATWLPNGLRFMRLITARPISMLVMELVVFPLCLVWFCWLAAEWSRSVPNPANEGTNDG